MAKKNNDWKKRDGVVYSTSDNFEYSYQSEHEENTLPPGKQRLIVSLDKKMRAGKQVTVVSGFVGSVKDLEELTKLLKSKCGVGGSSKDGEILIQGDMRDKLVKLLTSEGFAAKRSG